MYPLRYRLQGLAWDLALGLWWDTNMSTLPSAYVREEPCSVLARHARVSPAQHLGAGSASHYAGETHTCSPRPAQMCGRRFALCWRDPLVPTLPHTDARAALRATLAKTLTCLPCPARMCGKRFALRWRRHSRVCPAPHRCQCAGSASRICGRDAHVSGAGAVRRRHLRAERALRCEG